MPLDSFAFTGWRRGHTPPIGSTHGGRSSSAAAVAGGRRRPSAALGRHRRPRPPDRRVGGAGSATGRSIVAAGPARRLGAS